MFSSLNKHTWLIAYFSWNDCFWKSSDLNENWACNWTHNVGCFFQIKKVHALGLAKSCNYFFYSCEVFESFELSSITDWDGHFCYCRPVHPHSAATSPPALRISPWGAEEQFVFFLQSLGLTMRGFLGSRIASESVMKYSVYSQKVSVGLSMSIGDWRIALWSANWQIGLRKPSYHAHPVRLDRLRAGVTQCSRVLSCG